MILPGEELAGALRVGDVISAEGPNVPRHLAGKFFVVQGFDANGSVQLSRPYHDKTLTRPYTAPSNGHADG